MQGYNKRATVLFLLQRYQESIQDCQLVLDLNPYHFAAASGMGMCYRYSAPRLLFMVQHECSTSLESLQPLGLTVPPMGEATVESAHFSRCRCKPEPRP